MIFKWSGSIALSIKSFLTWPLPERQAMVIGHRWSCQCVANIWMFEYIQTSIDKYIHLPNYLFDFRTINIFRCSFVEPLHCKYLNIFEIFKYLSTTIFICQIFFRFCGTKYIWMFILQRKVTFTTLWVLPLKKTYFFFLSMYRIMISLPYKVKDATL